MLDFRILGPLEVVNDGGPLALGGQKQRALLALLLLNAREVVSTERLVGELWGEQPPQTATTSLQNLVSQLRKVLPAGRARHAAARLRARDRAATSSTSVASSGSSRRRERSDAGAARAHSSATRSRSGAARRSPTSPSRRSPRARSAGSRSSGSRRSRSGSTPTSSSGSARELVGELEALVAQHPLRERLRGQLMLALYRAGRQAEALQAYHDARRALVDELGIEPRPALQQLYRSILRQEAVLERAPPARADRRSPRGRRQGAARRPPRDRARRRASIPADDRRRALPGPGRGRRAPRQVVRLPARVRARPRARVAEYVALTKGVGPLYDELHALFDAGVRARAPSTAPSRGSPGCCARTTGRTS